MSTSRQPGFTLVELIVLIVVLAVSLVGILLVYSTSVRGSADPLSSKQALAAAEAMLEEIQLAAFCDPAGGFSGPATQANRQNFDDVGDYHLFATAGIHTIDGLTPIAGLERYNVDVSVVAAALSGIAAADSRLITVTVNGPTDLPNAATIVLAGYRTDYTGTCP